MRGVVEIEEDGRIWISTTGRPFEEILLRCKAVKPGRFDRDRREWSYPATMPVCYRLREVWGDDLEIGPDLRAWALAERARDAEIRALGAASDADLSVVPGLLPGAAEAMSSRRYQRSGAAFIARRRCAGVADEVGLGKTLMALAGIAEAGAWVGEHLIVANVSALDVVWAEEVIRWTGAEIYTATGSKSEREASIAAYDASAAPTKFLAINKEMLQIKLSPFCKKCGVFIHQLEIGSEEYWAHIDAGHPDKNKSIEKCSWPGLFTRQWTSVILDEAHKTLSTGNKSRAQRTQMAEGLMALQYAPDPMKIAVTATPFRGVERNIWGILNWMYPKVFTSFWNFADEYLTVTDNGFGKVIGALRPEKQQSFEGLLDTYFLRRTRAEVRKDLPARQHNPIWVTMGKAQYKQYRQFEKEGQARLESGTVESLGALAEITRLRQFAFGAWDVRAKDGKMVPTFDSPKLRRIEFELERRGLVSNSAECWRMTGGYKYIISSRFTEIVDMMEGHFNGKGIPSLKITGDVTGRARSDSVRSFQTDPDGPRLLLLNTSAAESITLDRYCDEMFIVDETDKADDQEQLEGRIDNRESRLNQGRPRTYHYIRTEDTIEEAIAKSNIAQDTMQKMLLDRRRGVESALRLLRREEL